MKDLLNYPFLKFLFPFIVGIITAYYWECPIHTLVLKILILLISIGIFVFYILKYNICRCLFISLMIALLSWIYTSSYLYLSPLSEEVFENYHYYQFQLKEYPKIGEKTVRCRAAILNSDTMSWFKTNIILTIALDSQSVKLIDSDKIWAFVKIQKTEFVKNPYMFDYKNYMRLKDVHLTAYLSSGNWFLKSHGHTNYLRQITYRIRQNLIKIFQNLSFENNELAVISAILLGEDDFLTKDLRQSYANAGVSHILCVSGMHLGIIYGVVYFLLSFLNTTYFRKVLKSAILLCIIWFYATLTGLSPSITRAATMFSFVILSAILKRETNIYYSLGASLCFLLIYNPLFLFQLGFQLSYLAIFGIVWFQSYIVARIKVKYKISRYIVNLAAVSFSAQLLTGPLAVYYFHQFPNYFILSNLSLMFISTMALIGGIVVLGLSSVSFLSSFLAAILNAILSLMNFIILKINNLPYSVTENIDIDFFQMLLIYVAILALFQILKFKSRYACFVLLLSFVVFFTDKFYSHYQCHQTSEVVIYAIDKHQLIQFRTGNTSVIYKDSSCYHSAFYVQNYNRIYHIEPQEYILEDLQGFKFNDLKMVFIGQHLDLQPSLNSQKVDVVWISRNPSFEIIDLIKQIEPQLIVFDLGNRKSYVESKIQECQALQIPYYSMYEQKCYRKLIN